MRKLLLFLPVLWVACVATERAAEVAIGEAEQPPKQIKFVPPRLPVAMRWQSFGGKVDYEILINPAGIAEDVRVIDSTNPWYERPVIDALLNGGFAPGRTGGKPVYARAKGTLEASLQLSFGNPWVIEKSRGHRNLPTEFQWDRAPVPQRSNFPIYPVDSLRQKVKGTAKVKFVINPAGQVVVAEIVTSSLPEFGFAAVASLETWLFTPPKKKDGTPCFAVVEMEHEFHPWDSGNVPVTESAREILKILDKNPSHIVSLRELDQMPKAVSQRGPGFPTILRDKGLSGEAEIEFFIDEKGDAQLPRIVSATAPEFGYAAAQAVAAWRFTPPKAKGKRAVVRVQVPIRFTLSSVQKEASP